MFIHGCAVNIKNKRKHRFFTGYLYKVEPYDGFSIPGIVCIIDGVVH